MSQRAQQPGRTRYEPQASLGPLIAVFVIAAVLVLAGGTTWLALWAGAKLDGRRSPGSPIDAIGDLLIGKARFTGSAWTVLWASVAVLIVLLIAAVVLVVRIKGRRSRVDRAARHMGRGRDIAPLRLQTAQTTAKRLGVKTPGLLLATTVAAAGAAERLYAGWEDVMVVLFGPRQGKTTSFVIPMIVGAPGNVVTTSNKRNVVDATRDVQAARGPVWIFDPQGIAGEQSTWWWNPLSYVTDEMKADALAQTLIYASTEEGARSDSFFDPAKRSLLTDLILAAAVAGEPLTQVYVWLTQPEDDTPVRHLREAGHHLHAYDLIDKINLPHETKGGVYAGALNTMAFLRSSRITAWITPNPGLPAFSTAGFVREPASTIYLLSKEGNGSAGPLVTALAVALTEAAEEHAMQCAGGRLPVPLVAVLDEVANVCRWQQLPAQYSHYGSRGIFVVSILQSYAQGEEVWGRSGMRKLWSAATIKVIGSGLGEFDFSGDMSQLIGDYRVQTTSVSSGRGGSSRSTQTGRERILDASELASLPKGRAVIMGSGARPVLVKTMPWMNGPSAPAISASIAAHDPQGLTPTQALTAAKESRWPTPK